jgi:hypothetical protein
MMVQHHDVEGAGRSVPQSFLCTLELAAADASRLVPPGADRIETDHVERRRGIRRLRRLPLSLEGTEGVREARRNGVRDVVIARNRQHGPAKAAQESSRLGELALAAAMAEIPARDHELGLKPLDQDRRTPLDRRIVTGSEMEVGDV